MPTSEPLKNSFTLQHPNLLALLKGAATKKTTDATNHGSKAYFPIIGYKCALLCLSQYMTYQKARLTHEPGRDGTSVKTDHDFFRLKLQVHLTKMRIDGCFQTLENRHGHSVQ
jgi:hypothetical protein